jgi:hypothetical protein
LGVGALTGVHAFTEGAKHFGSEEVDTDGMYAEMKQLMRGFKVAEKEIPLRTLTSCRSSQRRSPSTCATPQLRRIS